MKVNSKTKISELIKANPKVVETIVSINKHFEKLRNPILQKLLAPRITIAEAARIGKVELSIFFEKLITIGFEIESDGNTITKATVRSLEAPDFVRNLRQQDRVELDVRKDIVLGRDPLKNIITSLSKLNDEQVLVVINTFEPIPLINILSRKGVLFFVEHVDINTIRTYFKRASISDFPDSLYPSSNQKEALSFSEMLEKYRGKLKETDVREMEMPMPMINVLQELERLPKGFALYVHHKRVPLHLLPELESRNYKLLINETETGEVKLLIYK